MKENSNLHHYNNNNIIIFKLGVEKKSFLQFSISSRFLARPEADASVGGLRRERVGLHPDGG